MVAALAAATVMLQGLSLGLGSLSTLTAAAAQRRMSVAVASDLYRAVNSISGLTRFDDPDFQDSLRLAEESAERVPAALTDMLATVLQGGDSSRQLRRPADLHLAADAGARGLGMLA